MYCENHPSQVFMLCYGYIMVLPYCTLTSNPYFFDSKESFPPVHTENTKMKCKNLRGRSRIFLGGVHHYFNTNKPHSFFAEYKLNYKAASHLRGGGGAHPLYPPPRSPLNLQYCSVSNHMDQSYGLSNHFNYKLLHRLY